MGDEQHRLARRHPKRLEVEAHLLARQRVECAERLVHQQQWRVVDQRPRDGHALAHAAREFVGVAIGKVFEADLTEQSQRPVPVGARVERAQLDLHEHVVERGAPVEQHGALEDDAQIGLRTIDDSAIDAHFAGARQVQARDQPQQGALAAARRSDDRQEFALPDRQVDALERMRFALAATVRLGDADDVDVGSAASRRSGCSALGRLGVGDTQGQGTNSLVWKVVQVLSVCSSR